jgi:glutathione S-transferase
VRHGQRTTPLLVTPHGTIRDSTDVLHHADKFVDERSRLFPTDHPSLREVEELEDTFDRKLGPATRRLAYFHVIDDPQQLRRLVEAGIGPGERVLFRLAQPGIVAFIRRGLRINREGAKKSEDRIEGVFAEVEKRLSSGGRYLVGDRFTAADLTFAALAGPVLLPPEYGWPLPSYDDCPRELQAIVARYRSHPAGIFALGLYREVRRRSPIPLASGA